MTLTIELPDELTERARISAEAHGLDLSTSVVAVVIDATDNAEDDGEDIGIIVAGFGAGEDRRGRRAVQAGFSGDAVPQKG